jgi:WD40 repeat protein
MSVTFATFPDGPALVVMGSSDRTVRLWDPITGSSIGQPLIGHTDIVTSVAFGALVDGRILLATGSFDRTITIWAHK